MRSGLEFLKSSLTRSLVAVICNRSPGWTGSGCFSPPVFFWPRYDGTFALGPPVCSQSFWGKSFLRLTAFLVVLAASLLVPIYSYSQTFPQISVPNEVAEGERIEFTVTMEDTEPMPRYVAVRTRGPQLTLGFSLQFRWIEIPRESLSGTGAIQTLFDGMDKDVTVSIEFLEGQILDLQLIKMVTVTVRDGGDAVSVPTFADGSSARRSFVPGAAPANVGAPVSAMNDNNDPLTYSLSGRDAGSFAINSGTGQIMTIAQGNYQVGRTYSVRVTADNGRGASATIEVSISALSTVAPSTVAPQQTPTPSPETCTVSGVRGSQSLKSFVECAAKRITESDTFEKTLGLLEEFRDSGGGWNDGSTYLVLLTRRGGVYFHADDRDVEDLDWSGAVSCEGGEHVVETREGCFIEYEGERSGYAHPFSASHVPLANGEEEFVLLGGFDGTPEGAPFTGEIEEPSTWAGDVDTDNELRGFVEEAGRVVAEAVENPDIDPAQLRGILRQEGPWRESGVHVYIMSDTGRVIFDGADRSREQGESPSYAGELIEKAGEGIVQYTEGGLTRRGYVVREVTDETGDRRVYFVGSGYREGPPSGVSDSGGGCAVGGHDGSGGLFSLFLAMLALFFAVWPAYSD